MYSVVLMTALATAGTPNWCHRQASCHSCSSCYGCYGGYAGYAGYSGYAGYGCYGCHGCHGPVGYGAAGGCYGYHGGCYGAFGVVHADTYNGSCYGCHGGHSGYGVPLPVQVAPGGPKSSVKDPFPPINPKKDGEEIPKLKEKGKSEEQSRAKIRIEIPEGGKLFVDGRHINVAPGTRIFQTPDLAQGETYFYDIRIEIERNGITRGEEQRVVIQLGQDAFVSFPTLRPAAPFTAQVRP